MAKALTLAQAQGRVSRIAKQTRVQLYGASRRFQTKCQHCEKKFESDDIVVTKRKKKWYHYECADKLNVI